MSAGQNNQQAAAHAIDLAANRKGVERRDVGGLIGLQVVEEQSRGNEAEALLRDVDPIIPRWQTGEGIGTIGAGLSAAAERRKHLEIDAADWRTVSVLDNSRDRKRWYRRARRRRPRWRSRAEIVVSDLRPVCAVGVDREDRDLEAAIESRANELLAIRRP